MDTSYEVSTRLGPVSVRVVGDGPPVLALHGLLLDGRFWDGVAEHLAGRVRLLVPDLPLGAHRRPVPDRTQLTSVGVAGAALDVLDGLGVDSAVLLGNDTGGALAQIAAADQPDRVAGLVLAGCDAFEHFPPPLVRPVVTLAAVPGATLAGVRALGLSRLLAEPGSLNLFTTRGLGRDTVDSLLQPARTDPAVRADLTTFVRQMRPEPLLAASRGLAVHAGRAAVVWGRRDRVFPGRDAERLARLLGTTVTWLDDSSSFVPVDRPDAIASAVLDVVARGGGPSPGAGHRADGR